MNWKTTYLPEAVKDIAALAGNQRILIIKAIDKVGQDPLPASEGDYGKPLGSKGGNNLSGLLKIKLKSAGLRVVYKLVQTESEMLVMLSAQERMKKYTISRCIVSKSMICDKKDQQVVLPEGSIPYSV